MFGSRQKRNERSRSNKCHFRILVFGFAIGSWSFTGLAFAEEDARTRATRAAAARSLFNEARALMQAGKPEKACPKLEESLRLEPGVGTRFNLADCWQAIDRTASAWTLFLDVAAEARASGQAERAEVATERANALEPRLSYLIVTVASPRDGQMVWLGPVELGRGAWGSRWPIDKGTHELRSEAPGFRSSSQTVLVTAPGDLEITLQPLAPIPSKATAPAQRTKSPFVDDPSRDRHQNPDQEASTSGETSATTAKNDGLARAIGIPTLLVLGLAGQGLGTYFVIRRNNLNSRAEALCLDGACSRPELDRHTQLIGDARSAQTYGIISFSAGGACLVGAALWYLLGQEDSAYEGVSVNGRDGLGLSYRRTW